MFYPILSVDGVRESEMRRDADRFGSTPRYRDVRANVRTPYKHFYTITAVRHRGGRLPPARFSDGNHLTLSCSAALAFVGVETSRHATAVYYIPCFIVSAGERRTF